jgi:hypothetical protein
VRNWRRIILIIIPIVLRGGIRIGFPWGAIVPLYKKEGGGEIFLLGRVGVFIDNGYFKKVCDNENIRVDYLPLPDGIVSELWGESVLVPISTIVSRT